MKQAARCLAIAGVAFLLAACSGGSGPDSAASSGPPQRLLSATLSDFKGNGTWWNPAEPGTGFVFEAQGATGVITFFVYEASGKPVWVSGPGTFTLRADGKYAFAATLYRYRGGQPATSTTPATPQRTSVGDASVVFDGNAAQVTVPGRSYAATKFNPTTAESGAQPEAGIYWNAGESGRGYTIEVANNIASIGVFHYDSAGEPTWNLIVGDIATGKVQSAFTSYTGGQTLGGSYRVAQPVGTDAQFQANFITACNGTIQFPGMAPVTVSRFPFGGLAAGSECRSATPRVVATSCTVTTAYNGNFETTNADAGSAGAGSGGGDGDGGGAAAGGGLGKVLGGLMRVTDLSDGSLVGEALTDTTTGLVTIRTCGRPGPFLLRLEGRVGARYFDEGLNQRTDFGAGNVLHALVDKWDEHVGVSPITEAAYRYALNTIKINPSDVAEGRTPLRAAGSLVGLTKAQAAAANKVVQDEINRRFTTNYQLPSAKALSTPIDETSATNALQDNRYGRSAAINGGLVKAAQFYNPGLTAPALKFTEDLSRDLTDGRIDGFALDSTAAASAAESTYGSIRLPLAGTIATNALADRFAATTLKPAQLRIDETSGVLAEGGSYATGLPSTCEVFQDTTALMSDRSVTVVRHFPTRLADGTCVYRNDAQERERDVKFRRFLTDVKFLAKGQHTGFAVKTDGSVWGWGDNHCGGMDPTAPNGVYAQPRQVAGLRDVTSISEHGKGSLARDSTGALYFWGSFNVPARSPPPAGMKFCHRRDNIDVMQPTSMQKIQMTDVVDVYAHAGSYFALNSQGHLYGWGSGALGLLANSDGTIFDGGLTGIPVAEPTRIAGLGPVRQIGVTGTTVFALQRDGTVAAWGNDDDKLLGNGVARPTPRPVVVPGLTGIVSMATSAQGVRLLRADGTALAWGSWNPTILGQAYFTPTLIPSAHIRHIGSRSGLFTVYFSSGTVGWDLNDTQDLADFFR